jgi:DNA helicase IV
MHGLIVTKKEFEERKIVFVRRWFEKELSSSKHKVLDDEQLEAIAALHGHVKVVARAGSGKTLTLVNRTLFLMRHCDVNPQEILILAFNRKAADEVRSRLRSLLNENSKLALPDVRGAGRP